MAADVDAIAVGTEITPSAEAAAVGESPNGLFDDDAMVGLASLPRPSFWREMGTFWAYSVFSNDTVSPRKSIVMIITLYFIGGTTMLHSHHRSSSSNIMSSR